MRTKLNLSKNPFTNRRLFWVAVAAVFFITLWTSLWITAEKSAINARASEVSGRIKAQADEVERIKLEQEQERQKKEASKVVLTDNQIYELASARRLIAFKAFSWNSMVSDIEKYVPENTRITSILINEILEGEKEATAALELKAIGKSAAQMTEMMTKLEQSKGLFSIGQAVQEQADGNETPFTLILTYRPSRGET